MPSLPQALGRGRVARRHEGRLPELPRVDHDFVRTCRGETVAGERVGPAAATSAIKPPCCPAASSRPSCRCAHSAVHCSRCQHSTARSNGSAVRHLQLFRDLRRKQRMSRTKPRPRLTDRSRFGRWYSPPSCYLLVTGGVAAIWRPWDQRREQAVVALPSKEGLPIPQPNSVTPPTPSTAIGELPPIVEHAACRTGATSSEFQRRQARSDGSTTHPAGSRDKAAVDNDAATEVRTASHRADTAPVGIVPHSQACSAADVQSFAA